MDAVLQFAVGAILCLFAFCAPATAKDLGQWSQTDPLIHDWYQKLMQPDRPTASCCGTADAYFCDEIHVKDGHTSCAITDDRPDEPRDRPHVPVGTVIDIPDSKLKWDEGNPTGHAVVFLGRNGGYDIKHYVFCFVQNGGV